MSGPSQPQVTDEIWDDERVKSFLALESPPAKAGEDADFHVLLRAYRGMRADDFARFLNFFTESGRNLDATDHRGRTLWSIIEHHQQGTEFVELRNQYS